MESWDYLYPSRLDLRNHQLTDSRLRTKLQQLEHDYTEIDLRDNDLNQVPDVSQYPHLQKLDRLNLAWNRIKQWSIGCVPQGIQYISLQENNITEVGDFTALSQLKKLDLSHNHIQAVHGNRFPKGIQILCLWGNKINEVGDFTTLSNLKKLFLSDNNIQAVDGTQFPKGIHQIKLLGNMISEVGDFTTLNQLKKLDLSKNNIHSANGKHFPVGIKEIYLWGNKISEVEDFTTLSNLKKLFLSDNNIQAVHGNQFPKGIQAIGLSGNQISEVGDFTTLHQLKKLNLSNNNITQVPEMEHLTQLKELHLCSNKIHKLQTVKQYMVHSHMLQCNAITHIAKECFSTSEIYEYLQWNLDTANLEQPPKEVFQRGLVAVREYFMHKLIRGSRNRLVLLGPTEAGKSSIMESLLAGRPVLVHLQNRTQVLDVQTLEIAPDEFLEIFDQGGHPVYAITNHLFLCPRSTVLLVHDVTKVSDEDTTETVDILCQALHKHPGNELHIVLTHIDQLERDALEANSQKIMQKITNIIQEEIDNIERLGQGNLPKHKKKSHMEILSNLKKKQHDMKYFKLSSKSFEGIADLQSFLKDSIHEESVVVPEVWLHFYSLIEQEKKCFLDMDDVQAICERLSQFNEVTALNYYNDIGMVLYFEQNANLNNYVFHQLEFLINAFKAVFHHNILEVFDYESDRYLQSQFKEPEFDMAIKQYRTEGLLSLKLLSCFWKKYQLKNEHQDALLELMRAFDICYPVTLDKKLLFLPWFVKNKENPKDMDMTQIWLTTNTLVSIQLNCVFYNRIPRNVFEMMCVRLQKLAIENHYLGERSAWKNGLVVQFGSTKCLILRDEEASTIKVCVQGKVENLIEIWTVMRSYYGNIKDVLDQWDGALKAFFFICSHCKFFRKKSKKKWLLDEVFPKAAVTQSHIICPNDEVEVPRALVVALTDNTASAKDVLVAKQYLQEQPGAQTPVPRLSYLDCIKESADTFQLSWTWPSEIYNAAVTGAVVEYRTIGNDWQRVPETIRKRTYRFKGVADEFCVALENRNGPGEFSFAKPMPSLLDEKISEQDGQEIQSTHESFCGMTNITTISARLLSRGVIERKVEEAVLRFLQYKEPFNAAKKLMEEVYRFDYRQLYFFKKTLKETGQDILAEAVPVRLEDGSEIELDDVC